MKREVWSVLFVAAASVALGACDSGIPLNGGATVNVTLSEWQIVTDRNTAPTGKIVVEASNKGADVHDLVLLETDLPPDGLPVTAKGDVDLAASGVLVVSEIKDLAPGASGELTIDEAGPGKYVFVSTVATSNGMIVGHPYAKGMFKAFTVAEVPGQE
jgi:uncharacterized cupredoxin-like copper-binding protein